MGKPTGFLEIERRDRPYEKPESRSRSWKEFVKPLPDAENRKQAARCMDCGIPFCHEGCPVNNLIPDWNNLVYRDQWREIGRASCRERVNDSRGADGCRPEREASRPTRA